MIVVCCDCCDCCFMHVVYVCACACVFLCLSNTVLCMSLCCACICVVHVSGHQSVRIFNTYFHNVACILCCTVDTLAEEKIEEIKDLKEATEGDDIIVRSIETLYLSALLLFSLFTQCSVFSSCFHCLLLFGFISCAFESL